MRIRYSAAAVLLAVACGNEREKSASPAERPIVPASVAQTTSLPVTQDEAADAFAAEYRSIMQGLRRWDGDAAAIEEARTRIKAILAKDRRYAPAYVALARAESAAGYQSGSNFEPGALDRASKFIQHAIKLDSENFEAHCAAAWVARYRGDLDLAEESLRRAEELKPGTPEVKLIRASIANAQDDLPQMVKLAREVAAGAESVDDRVQAYSYLIRGYEAGLHLDEADAAHREVLKLRPDSAWLHGNYASFLLRRQDIDGAIREAEEAVRIRKYPNAVSTLVRSYIAKAQILWDANKISESAAYIQKVVGVAGEDSNLSYALGQFYEHAAIRSRDASMRAKALASYRRTLELNPRHIDAERAIQRLSR